MDQMTTAWFDEHTEDYDLILQFSWALLSVLVFRLNVLVLHSSSFAVLYPSHSQQSRLPALR